jgi:hypothetical protein
MFSSKRLECHSRVQEGQRNYSSLNHIKTIVIHALKLCDPASRVHFCSWFVQCIIEDEIALQLTFFSDEAWFHLQGYIYMKNNRY